MVKTNCAGLRRSYPGFPDILVAAYTLMAVTKTTVTIYGWILKVVQMLTGLVEDVKSIKQTQDAQSKQLAEIIRLLTPSEPVAFRIDLTHSNQGE